MEACLVERARMICKLQNEESVSNVASDLKVRPRSIIDWRVLSKQNICLARQRSWCVSPDPPQFAPKVMPMKATTVLEEYRTS